MMQLGFLPGLEVVNFSDDFPHFFIDFGKHSYLKVAERGINFPPFQPISLIPPLI